MDHASNQTATARPGFCDVEKANKEYWAAHDALAMATRMTRSGSSWQVSEGYILVSDATFRVVKALHMQECSDRF